MNNIMAQEIGKPDYDCIDGDSDATCDTDHSKPADTTNMVPKCAKLEGKMHLSYVTPNPTSLSNVKSFSTQATIVVRNCTWENKTSAFAEDVCLSGKDAEPYVNKQILAEAEEGMSGSFSGTVCTCASTLDGMTGVCNKAVTGTTPEALVTASVILLTICKRWIASY